MKIFLDKSKIIKETHKYKNIGFVPTMGSLHNAHISLIKKSVKQSNKTIVSIFINKPQFNKKNDFIKYPRNLRKDISILKNLKIDILYLPSHKEIYPNGSNKNIKIDKFSKQLCGKFRLRHFESIIDVVDRFIKIIRPKNIYLGEKDFQQLILIEKYIRVNSIKTKVVRCRTLREDSGLPYSSRNLLLSKKEKEIASKVYRFVKSKKKDLIKKKISNKVLCDKISQLGINKIEYLKLLDVNKIIKPFKKSIKNKIFIAYYIGLIRLIDNI